MNVNPVASTALQEIADSLKEIHSSGGTEASKEGGFANYLKKSIGDVNDMLAMADKKSVELSTGKSENLHDAMITFEKAETALKLLVQTRNKALEAYHEVMRMQV